MRINLQDIKRYAKCPRFYYLLGNLPPTPPDQQVAITESVIKKSYLTLTETGFRAPWRRIIGWVDSQVFRGIESLDDEGYQACRSLSEHILFFLQTWYEFYQREMVPTFVDVEVQHQVGDHVVYGLAPIVKLTDPVTLTWVSGVATSNMKIYNDINKRGTAALLATELGIAQMQCEELFIGPKGGFEQASVTLGKEEHKSAGRMIRQVSGLLAEKIDYPARSKQCEICPFHRRCRI